MHQKGEIINLEYELGVIYLYGHIEKIDDIPDFALKLFKHLFQKFGSISKVREELTKSEVDFNLKLGKWVPSHDEPDSMMLVDYDLDSSQGRKGWFKFTQICSKEDCDIGIAEFQSRYKIKEDKAKVS